MKRGADAMDARDSLQSDRNGGHSQKRPETDHKRMRRADDGRSRDGSAGAKVKTEVRTLADEKETDPHRLAQRQKQIDYGKNTIGYDRYCAQVLRHQRRPGRNPMTPDKTKKVGKKVFDGMVRKWRQALHKYDPPELTKTAVVEASPLESSKDVGNCATGEKRSEEEVNSTSTLTISDHPEVKKDTAASSAIAPPSRSIYENFDEDNFDEVDSDDDLL